MRIAVAGATSGIAAAAIRLWAARGDEFFLCARSAPRLAAVAADARVRGANRVIEYLADLDDVGTHAALLRQAEEQLEGPLDVILLAWGVLGEEAQAQRDPAAEARVFHTDFVAPASLAALAAEKLHAQGRGCLAVISSVAGERSRADNYVYASAKAGLSAYLEGLAARIRPSGARVLTIKPGPVDTPMTSHLSKTPLFLSPEEAGRLVVRAIEGGGDEAYLPRAWGWAALLLKLMPGPLYRTLASRMSHRRADGAR